MIKINVLLSVLRVGLPIAIGTVLFSSRACAEWIRPDSTQGAPVRPVWGIVGGMSLGLWPTLGPRGLLRIYAPYLGQGPDRMINFIAIEPIVGDDRGLSELEQSQSDARPGKQMWTTNTLAAASPPKFPALPASGILSRDGKVEQLRFVIHVERFRNGAEPVIQVTFRSDRPREVELQTFSSVAGAPMRACVLTATMGNWARLRHLQLKDHTIEAKDLFRDSKPGDAGFLPWFSWPASELRREGDRISVSATGDLDAMVPDDVPAFWRYVGQSAVQSWSTTDRPGVVTRVNGRREFWASRALVPGGPAFENFELLSPFQAGQDFVFGIQQQ